MDLNELLHAHQAEVRKASASGDEEGRQRHFDKVAVYAESIRQLRAFPRRSSPTSSSPASQAKIHGACAGDPSSEPSQASLDSWEDEGGSIVPPHTPLRAGVTTNLRRDYYVGSFVYRDISFALAEHDRQRNAASLEGAEGE